MKKSQVAWFQDPSILELLLPFHPHPPYFWDPYIHVIRLLLQLREQEVKNTKCFDQNIAKIYENKGLDNTGKMGTITVASKQI